jgi:hypothetical protein
MTEHYTLDSTREHPASHSSQQLPSACVQGLDGVLLVVDAARADDPAAERELEALYSAFAQPSALTMRQCMVLAIDVRGSAVAGGAAAWAGTCVRRLQCRGPSRAVRLGGPGRQHSGEVLECAHTG